MALLKVLNKIQIWDFESDHEDDKLINKANYETKSVYGSGHLSFYKEIIDILKIRNSIHSHINKVF